MEAWSAEGHCSWAEWRALAGHERGRIMAFHVAKTYRTAVLADRSRKAMQKKEKRGQDGMVGTDPSLDNLRRMGWVQ